MANMLRQWKSPILSTDRLELPCGEGSFTETYFDDPGHHEQLLSYLKEFFTHDIKVVFTKQHEPRNSKGHSPLDDLSAPTRDIIDIFEGRITDRD
jgi:hypothetical protein